MERERAILAGWVLHSHVTTCTLLNISHHLCCIPLLGNNHKSHPHSGELDYTCVNTPPFSEWESHTLTLKWLESAISCSPKITSANKSTKRKISGRIIRGEKTWPGERQSLLGVFSGCILTVW